MRLAMRLNIRCDPRTWSYRLLERFAAEAALPDPLTMEDGSPVSDARTWRARRRAELLEAFRAHEYGRAPASPSEGVCLHRRVSEHALHGNAVRKQMRLSVSGQAKAPSFSLLLYLPTALRRAAVPAPVFLGLNFLGNHTVTDDTEVDLPRAWIPDDSRTRGRLAESLRGLESGSWCVEDLIARGYGLATVYAGDFVPDRVDAAHFGIQRWFREAGFGGPQGESWGAIAGWAWGLSRAMDHLCHDEDVDARRIVLFGHSRLGKAALWCGAQDTRFAAVIANNSGCGGAALARRKFGERVADVNRVYPHWFCARFRDFNGREEALPVDQHELLALIAPRPLYIASAESDLGADPMGEFSGAWHAGRVYAFLGARGLPERRLPAPDVPMRGTITYHIRTGPHGITRFDWAQFTAFADRHVCRPPC
jgi:hypothetical protein